jgi:putative hemolysin
VLPLRDGREIGQSYAAQYYGLSGLGAYPGRMGELGRFCSAPGATDPDILRTAWGALARIVDSEGVEMLFGCSSFSGTDADDYTDAFAMLRDRHLAPRRWLPRVKAPDVFRFARKLRRAPDATRALRTMPPLLRSYLAMGGWVSDHAVVDRDLGTLHVFTGLEIRAIPPSRARALRNVAALGA